MKRSVLLFTLLLTGSAAHAQYGGMLAAEAIGMGLNMLKTPLQKPTEFVTTTSYGQQQLRQKRTPVAQVPGKGGPQIMAIEQQLAACYQLLQASPTAPLLTGSHSQETLVTALGELARIRPSWNLDAYREELEFYRQQHEMRQLLRQEQRAAQAARQRDSTQLATLPRALQDNRQLSASPTLAYVNSTGDVAMYTQPYGDGKCIGYIAFGSPVSILHTSPGYPKYSYISAKGVYGWVGAEDLASSIQSAYMIGVSGRETIRARPPGYIGLKLKQEPALVALTPTEYKVDSTARAKEMMKERAYNEAHPPKERAIKNNTVYVDLEEEPRVDGAKVDVIYHLSRDCYFVPDNDKAARLTYSKLASMPSYINFLRCATCGYDYPKPYNAQAKAAPTRPLHTAKVAPAKSAHKPAPHK
jgi:hypothetical protein